MRRMPMMLVLIVGYVLVRRWNGDVVQLAAVVGVLTLGYVAYRAYQSRQESQRADEIDEADITALEARVESMFADAANRILAVEGRAGLADTPEAEEHFRKGVTIFVSVDERLDTASSSAQLRWLFAELDEALWQLTAAQALLDGEQPRPRSNTTETARPPKGSVSLSAVSREAVARWADGGPSGHKRRRRSC